MVGPSIRDNEDRPAFMLRSSYLDCCADLLEPSHTLNHRVGLVYPVKNKEPRHNSDMSSQGPDHIEMSYLPAATTGFTTRTGTISLGP